MTYMDFAILNSHVTVIHLRFIKSTSFFVVKQKHLCFPRSLSLYIRCASFETRKLLVK